MTEVARFCLRKTTMASLLLITFISLHFAKVAFGDDSCMTKLPVFISCMKNELFPENSVDVQPVVEKMQTYLGECFTKNQCTAPKFNEGLDTLFPSSVQNFVDKITTAFKSLNTDVKTCLMRETMGKMMGDACQFDEATQSEITDVQDKPRLSGVFGQFVKSNEDDMEHMRQMLKQVFLAKYNMIHALRVCNESNAANGAKVLTCLTDYKNKGRAAVCPVVKSCLPTTGPCVTKLHDFRNKMCGCHQQCIQEASRVINSARSDTTASNAKLVQMIVDGLHFKDMLAGAKTCFNSEDPGYKAFSMIEDMFNGLDSQQAAIMLNGLDIKGLIGQASDMLNAMNDNEFCQNACNV